MSHDKEFERRIDQARQQDIVGLLERMLGEQPKSHGSYVMFKGCPACGESTKYHVSVRKRENVFVCFRCNAKGDTIEALMQHEGIGFVDAVNRLAGNVPVTPVTRPARDIEREKQEREDHLQMYRKVFTALKECTKEFVHEPKCIAYLTRERALPLEVVREAQRRGMLGFLPSDPMRAKELVVAKVGEALLRKSGLWKEDKKVPGIIYRPIVFFLPGMTSCEFRMHEKPTGEQMKSVRYGLLTYPYFWEGADQQVIVVEGILDTLALVALGFKGSIIGLPGSQSFREEWVAPLQRKYAFKRWTLSLDPDKGGELGTKRIATYLEKARVPFMVKPPTGGDINDVLRRRAQKQMAEAA